MASTGTKLSPKFEEEREYHMGIKEDVWLLFEDAQSSTLAYYISTVILTCIALSSVTFLLESIPTYENWPGWWYCELVFVCVFSTEYIMRFWSVPYSRWRFFWEPMNLIDFAAVLPFYIEIIVMLTPLAASDAEGADLRILRLIRLVRVFRLLKIGKFSTTIQVVMTTMARSAEALIMLSFCLLVALLMFGSLMYCIERGEYDSKLDCYVREGESSCSPFQSVSSTFYWGFTTLTTVGYGDVLPTTRAGQIVCNLAMIVGVLCIALPVTMIGNEMTNVWKETENYHRTVDCTRPGFHLGEQMDNLVEKTHAFQADNENLVPEIKKRMIQAAVANRRFTSERAAQVHMDQLLAPIEDDLAHATRDFVQYVNLIRDAHRGKPISAREVDDADHGL